MSTFICRQCGKKQDIQDGRARQRNPRFCGLPCYWQNRRGKSIHGYKHRAPDERKKCEGCAKEYRPRRRMQRFCSRPCLYSWLTGPTSPSWRGGRTMKADGYVLVYARGHPEAHKGRVLEHRLVMERMLGRPLRKDETVHHINGDKADNHPENLQLCRKYQGKGFASKCADCGSTNIISEPLHGG